MKFNKNLIKEILQQKMIDVEIYLHDCDLIEHDNWILEQIRKRDDVLFRYVGFKYGQERVMRIYTNE